MVGSVFPTKAGWELGVVTFPPVKYETRAISPMASTAPRPSETSAIGDGLRRGRLTWGDSVTSDKDVHRHENEEG